MTIKNHCCIFKRNAFISDLVNLTESDKRINDQNCIFNIAGKIVSKRHFGKIYFFTIKDQGSSIQLLIKNDSIDGETWSTLNDLNRGDVVGVTGYICLTTNKTIALQVSKIFHLVKAVNLLPNKYSNLRDKELIYRMRYIDLIMNDKSYSKFLARSKLVHLLRTYLYSLGFIEVETPLLHDIPSGTAAKPFKTFHNSLDMELFLRVAPELYLKKLQVGGMSKIFEINKSFRNEGLSKHHNPEFTMLELYESYIDYEDMMCFTEQLIHHISAKAAVPDTHLIRKQFTVLSIHSALQKYLSLSTDSISDVDHLCELLSNHGYSNAYNKLSLVQYEVFDKLVSPLIVEPTFIIGYPIELSPLAKASNENPDIAQRAELFYKGYELANLYSEQNDAELQRQALLKQNEILYDASYIEALKYGLPPCAGLGIGIDRLLMSIFDIEYIKDIILFPTLRPK